MTKEKFIEMISIDDDGHFPFQMIVEDENEQFTLSALALDDAVQVYRQVLKAMAVPFRKIFFTLDFSAGRDLSNDFVAVHFKEKGKSWELVLIPYDAAGNRLPMVTNGEMYEVLLRQCRQNCAPLFIMKEKA